MPKKQPLYPHVSKSKLGAFLCGQCGERFHSMEELNKHLAEYHPEAYASVPRAEGQPMAYSEAIQVINSYLYAQKPPEATFREALIVAISTLNLARQMEK